jgi:TonB family protein
MRAYPHRVSFILTSVIGALLLEKSLPAQSIRVQDEDAKRAAIQKVQPAYSPIARQMNLTGRVLLDLTVNTDGSVEKADVVSGNPILGSSAVTAAKRWKFQPFQSDVKPAEAVVRIAPSNSISNQGTDQP